MTFAKPAQHEQRLRDLRRKLRDRELDAFWVCDRRNIRYLCGFDGTFARLVVDRRSAVLITDSRYAEIAEGITTGAHIWVLPLTDATAFYQKLFKKWGFEKLGFEGTLSVDDFDLLKQYARPSKTRLEKAGELIAELRIVKDKDEIRLIAKAAIFADRLMATALESLRPGISELELSRILRRAAEDIGADGESFDSIVASGPNSSRPHHHPLRRALRPGDTVTIDLGCLYQGYCSDMTRNFTLGPPKKKIEEIHAVCLEAQEAALRAAHAGMTGAELDAVARDLIESRGYGAYFGHGLGHGVGMEIHEPPRLNKSSATVLRAGHIVTIEPGIYIPGVGGVRIEDLIVITDGKPRVLSHFPKLLTQVPV